MLRNHLNRKYCTIVRMLTWQALAVLSVVFYSIGVVVQKTILKERESDPWAYSIVFQLIVAGLIWCYSLVVQGKNISLTLPLYNPNIILMTLLWAGANIFSFNAIKITEASTFSILLTTRVLFTTLASYVFLKEILSVNQVLGMLLVLGGSVLVSIKKSKLRLNKRQVTYSVLAAVCVGFAATNDRVILRSLDVETYSVISYTLPPLFMLVVNPYVAKKLKVFAEPSRVRDMLIFCLFWVGFALTFNTALQNAPSSSQVLSINVTSIVLIVILSILFLKERENITRKIIGAGITLAGLLLVF